MNDAPWPSVAARRAAWAALAIVLAALATALVWGAGDFTSFYAVVAAALAIVVIAAATHRVPLAVAITGIAAAVLTNMHIGHDGIRWPAVVAGLLGLLAIELAAVLRRLRTIAPIPTIGPDIRALATTVGTAGLAGGAVALAPALGTTDARTMVAVTGATLAVGFVAIGLQRATDAPALLAVADGQAVPTPGPTFGRVIAAITTV